MIVPLAGSWALILGSSSGMGAATAEALAREGVNVLGVHFDTARAAEATDALVDKLRAHGGEIHFVNANAASPSTRADVVAELRERSGGQGARVLLHSLAFGSLVPFIPPPGEAGVSARQLDMTLNVMAHSLVYWTQDVVARGLMGPGGRIFAMTSAGDARVSANYGPVSAAKNALQSHVRQLAVELAPRGIAVNALRAGVTATPSLLRIPEHEALLARARAGNPHGRLTTPEDVAAAVVALSADDSSWLTGNVIGVDGGEALTT
jgi:NAD(P)-dependent dehydrogenase (short-subunit alcohol dehydrogenase family)